MAWIPSQQSRFGRPQYRILLGKNLVFGACLGLIQHDQQVAENDLVAFPDPHFLDDAAIEMLNALAVALDLHHGIANHGAMQGSGRGPRAKAADPLPIVATESDRESDAAQNRLLTLRRHIGQTFDREPAPWPWQGKTAIAQRVGGKQVADPQEGRARGDQIAPGTDQLLHRLAYIFPDESI